MKNHKTENWTVVSLDCLEHSEKIFKALVWIQENVNHDEVYYELSSLRMFFKDERKASMMLLSI